MVRYYRLLIVSADQSYVLNSLLEKGVRLQDVSWMDELTVEVKVSHKQIAAVRGLLDQKAIPYKIAGKNGNGWILLGVLNRPVLLLGMALFFLLALWLPGRIFFLDVTGNAQVPDAYILEAADKCGVHFGAKSALVRSEEIKNHILAQLPELQWVGVTTCGFVATIQVKERSELDSTQQFLHDVSSIVAGHDGVISEISVLQGAPLVQPGQAVKQGDILISGYTDCGRIIKAQQAKGEIYAHTIHKITAVSVNPVGTRGGIFKKHTCYKIKIGKKVINLCNHSGISDVTCVKMYSEDYWTFPGDFRLPVALMKEQSIYYDFSPDIADGQSNEWLSDYMREYLLSQMVAGQILDQSLTLEYSFDGCILLGEFACHEMIGQVKHEELIEQYAEDN